MIVVGVDPGVHGAFALLDLTPGRAPSLLIHEMPRLEMKVGKSIRQRVDLHGCAYLGRILALNAPDFAVVEDVQGFGSQNAAASFVFGRATCAAEMAFICNDCALRYVKPETWKKALGLSAVKENAILEAKRLFPTYAELFTPTRGVITKEQAIGNAEASLIAYYGATKLS